jgi:phosphoglycolate phosphatase
LLVLFDCDGTLFVGDDPLAQQSMLDALERMTCAQLEPSDMDELDHEGRTARWLARELVRKHSLPEVDLADWAELAEEIYVERVGADDAVRWETPEGTREALETLVRDGFRLAILTGVPERIARLRFDRLGLGRWFPPGQGAFGSEAEEREDLLRLALERAGCPPEDAIAVGDTSRDVRSAQEHGLRAVAVAFAGPPPSAAEADGVVRSMPELVEMLRRLRDEAQIEPEKVSQTAGLPSS